MTEISQKTRSRRKNGQRQISEHQDYTSRQFAGCATLRLKVALGPHEISLKFRVAEKKLGQNSTVQIDRRNFYLSHEFAGGATD